MRPIYSILFTITVIITSCRGGENKADHSSHEITNDTDVKMTAPTIADSTTRSGQARGVDMNTNEPDEILAKIDEHLVSAAQLKLVPGGGINDCIVTVTNTLKDAGFQKALVEVVIRKDDSSLVKTDYYTIINMEPGMSKQIKVPDNSQGSMVRTRIVKVKSAELTNGEWVLVGKQGLPTQ